MTLPKWYEVFLTPIELMIALMAANGRYINAIKGGNSDTVEGSEGRHLMTDCVGAVGELALAKHLGVYWSGIGSLAGTDVGRIYEVKSTDRPDGNLLVHYKSSMQRDKLFVLAIWMPKTFKVIIAGCRRGDDFMDVVRYKHDPLKRSFGVDSWLVPRGDLNDAPEPR